MMSFAALWWNTFVIFSGNESLDKFHTNIDRIMHCIINYKAKKR
jgi:hypothetical protein